MSIADPKKEIIKQLEKVTSNGNRPSEIYHDFLTMTHATLEALPEQVRAVRTKVKFEDTPETAKLFEQMHQKYKPGYFVYFQNAFATLVESTDEFQDTLGEVYMEFGFPNKGTGQFFTPYSICQMMARLTCGDIERQVHDRIKDAIAESIEAQALLMAGMIISDPDEAADWFYNRVVIAAAPHVKPVTVCDCCCGSGAMLLAAAECCPQWALDLGFVRFFGQDIDQNCVIMAQTNIMLYGLNAFGIKCALGLTKEELAIIPEPWKEKFEQAQAADQAGDVGRVEEINQELKSWKQASLL